MHNSSLAWALTRMSFNKLGLFVLGLSLALSLSIFAGDKPVQVVAITQDFASIAKSIGGHHVRVQSLINGSRNLHAINPKPSMVLKVRSADLLIRLGMSQDSWIDGLIQVARNKRVFHGNLGYLDASDAISHKLEVPTERSDGSKGDVHAEGNPHYWLNPLNGVEIGLAIRDKLIQIDPVNKSTYEANFSAFKTRITSRMKDWTTQLAPVANREIITYHKVWPHFFDAFGLNGIGELEPLPGIPPTTKHLNHLKTRIKSSKNDTIVLAASFYPGHVGELFANSIDAPFVHVQTNVGGDGIKSYEGLFDYLVGSLTKE